jgi:hypothetical protein
MSVLAPLYEVATGDEVRVLDAVAIRSGAIWDCAFCHWYNVADATACENCSRTRADSALEEGIAYEPARADSIDFYEGADDYEANTLDHLRERAGLMWTCFCRWFNISSNTECENCGRTRAQSIADEDAI